MLQMLSVKQMKRAEKLTDRAGLSYEDMMHNAGVLSYQFIATRFGERLGKCVILCGSGNNGGDGFVVARKLFESGCDTTVVICCGNPTTEESMTMYNRLPEDCLVQFLEENQTEVIEAITNSTLIVDAVFGTGFHGDIDETLGKVLDFANETTAAKIALDIPSGIAADSGECCNSHFIADVTIAFSAAKAAHRLEESKASCGAVEILDIGIPNDILFMVQNNVTLIGRELIQSILPKRQPHTHKGNYGKLLNVAGSTSMCGAAMMSTMAAMRTGVGTTTLACPKSVATMCAPHMMEAMTLHLSENEHGSLCASCIVELDKKLAVSTACLVGCGLSLSPDIIQIVRHIIQNAQCSLVIDADALGCISTDLAILNDISVPTIITPHMGEMAKLTALSVEEVTNDIFNTASSFAKEHEIVVVLKGYNTVIATPDGDVYQNSTGNAGLAKGGSGDVLAGMIAAFVAQGMEAKEAAICGVYLHGMTADRLDETMSQYSMLARDIIAEIPKAIKEIEG